jgi:hypothetical protein
MPTAQSRDAKLSELFDTVVDLTLADLRDPTKRTSDLIGKAMKFLSDNQVEALPVPGSRVAELSTEVAASLPFIKKTG